MPAEERVARGTYRADRCGPLAAEEAGKTPPMPKELTKEERWMWARIAGLKRIDEASLPIAVAACEMWGLYRAAVAAAKAEPGDRDARINTIHYLNAVHRLAAAFGLSPADRARMGIVKAEKPKVQARKR